MGPESIKFNNEIQKGATQEATPSPPRPGGEVARHSLWSSRVEQGTMKEIGVKSPEGGFIRLNEGEHFAVIRDREHNKYEAIVRDDAGNTIRVLEEGHLSATREEDTEQSVQGKFERGKIVSELEKRGEVGKLFSKAYEQALREFPKLGDVEVKAGSIEEYPVLAKTGGFARHQSVTKEKEPLVVMNLDFGIGHYKKLMQERRVSAEISAQKMGIDVEKLTPQMLSVFIFLHELGHGYYYLTEVPDGEEYKKKREMELFSLPFPSWTPAHLANALESGGQLDQWYVKNEGALKLQGFPTRQSVIEAQERAYHNISTEDFPDQFAARILNGNDGALLKRLHLVA